MWAGSSSSATFKSHSGQLMGISENDSFHPSSCSEEARRQNGDSFNKVLFWYAAPDAERYRILPQVSHVWLHLPAQNQAMRPAVSPIKLTSFESSRHHRTQLRCT